MILSANNPTDAIIVYEAASLKAFSDSAYCDKLP